MIYFGIDPGQSGAIVAIQHSGKVEGIILLKESLHDICEFLRSFDLAHTALLEQVSSMPKQGVASTFKFGRSYGQVEALIVAHGIRLDRIRPRKWQTAVKAGVKSGMTRTQRLNAVKRRAQELFPQQKITHANAAALLLAELCRTTR